MIARNLQEVIRVSNPVPLTEKDFEQYYVNCAKGRGIDPVVRLCDIFRVSDTPQKILFTGHRGCGKTTELTRLIRELKDSFFIISFSAKEELDLNNLNFIDLIITMMTQVYKKAEDEKIGIQPELIEDINEWFSTIVKEYEERKGGGLEIETGGGISALNIFFSRLKGFLKTATTSKTLLRQTIEPRISELLDRSNILLREIKNCLDNKEILIIVEDLDKLDKPTAKSLFFEHSQQLISLNSHIIYTIPISILYSPEAPVIIRYFNGRQILPMIKVRKKDGSPEKSGIDLLREVVSKRISPDMFDENVLDEINKKSGGCLRDLLLFIRNSALSARGSGKEKIEIDSAIESFLELKGDYERAITEKMEGDVRITAKEYYKKLEDISSAGTIQPESDLVLMDLLHNLCVLEYNGERWLALHPIVEDIIAARRKAAKP